MQKTLNSGTEIIELIPGAVLTAKPVAGGSYAVLSIVSKEGNVSFVPVSTSATGVAVAGPFEFPASILVEVKGRVSVSVSDTALGGKKVLVLGTNGLETGTDLIVPMSNVGTAQSPVWEMAANILPRTNTLANLKSLASGGGELCSATDQPCIVQLNGVPGSSTAAVYSPMTPGIWKEPFPGSPDYEFRVPSKSINMYAPSLFLIGADNTHATGIGGFVAIRAGASPTYQGGGIDIRSGSTTTGGSGGNITISAGLAEGAVGEDGSVTISVSEGTGHQHLGMIQLFMGSPNNSFALSSDSYGDIIRATGNGEMAFFNGTGSTKPTVTGSRGGNAALNSLLTALATLGLITNNTTA